MTDGYDPWELLIRWRRKKLALDEAFEQSLKNQVKLDHHRKLNDRDVILQQKFIEEIFQILAEYNARIKVLEQKDDDNYKGNGVIMN